MHIKTLKKNLFKRERFRKNYKEKTCSIGTQYVFWAQQYISV